MTGARPSRPNPQAKAEKQQQHLHPKVLQREAAKVAADLGLALPPARIRLLVARYLEAGRADLDLRGWLLTYADPTGTEAVRHVMAQRRAS